MEEFIKKYNRNSILLSIFLIIFSIILIAKPIESLNILMIIVGTILILSGIFNAISYFIGSKDFKTFSIKLIIGIVSIVLGFLLIFNHTIINTMLIYIIGTWMIIQSIVKLQVTFNLKKLNSTNWAIMFILSLITLILGITILFNPFALITTVGTICGIMLLVTELINLFESIYILIKL